MQWHVSFFWKESWHKIWNIYLDSFQLLTVLNYLLVKEEKLSNELIMWQEEDMVLRNVLVLNTLSSELTNRWWYLMNHEKSRSTPPLHSNSHYTWGNYMHVCTHTHIHIWSCYCYDNCTNLSCIRQYLANEVLNVKRYCFLTKNSTKINGKENY